MDRKEERDKRQKDCRLCLECVPLSAENLDVKGSWDDGEKPEGRGTQDLVKVYILSHQADGG